VSNNTCTALGCSHVDTRRYMIGYRCDQHTPAKIAGRPEPAPPEPAARPVVDYLINSENLGEYLRQLPDRCTECGSHVETQRHRAGCSYDVAHSALRFVFPSPENGWQGQVIIDPGVPYAADYTLPPADTCDDCGEPYTAPGLITRCRDKHAKCRECRESFDQARGIRLDNGKSACGASMRRHRSNRNNRG
jgi:hypothetical protein